MRYRKIPLEVEATRWLKNGDHPLDGGPGEGKIVRYFRRPDISGDSKCKHCGNKMHDHGWIDTLEGGHIVCPGDYIITGIKGEFYPRKSDIFERSYRAMRDE